MPEGNIALGTSLDTRPVTKALSDIKAKVKYAFKGMDAKELSNSVKEVNSDIRRTETEAAKAKAALDNLMSGQTFKIAYRGY